ncbi:FGGY family carbohydrate kinase [Aquabacterium sp.]|uniref:FGGY family carbohydrate kinase n=1 Tax=Aquabacterium sp. TaxID=1872578 RepID=UPI002BA4FA17|nr:FGGY family carbohydrate kinase [Aquabacterium sp.]HSW05542.1 FGGY family carbohydrate kinase [Aquabacterium sp.]
MDHVLAIDQGTSATKCVLVDARGGIVAKAAAPVGERYPAPGWVEQDADEIWHSLRAAVAHCLAQRDGVRVVAIGLSTQRESALLWQHEGAKALTPLLSWQDRRTVELRDRLAAEGAEPLVRARSGLPLDPMFSALKIRWLLDRLDPERRAARSGALRAGTIDAWLIARLGSHSGGDDGGIEVGNASRTQLLDVQRGSWDDDLLRLFNVPRAAMPAVRPSLARRGDGAALHPALAGVPVQAVMADSHAALFAHGAHAPGDVKATMGTGASVMGLAHDGAHVHPGLCRTIAWDVGPGPLPALEGNIRSAGATLRWAADLFGLEPEVAAAEAAGAEAAGLCLVPAFSGLGAPYWDAHAVGLISGLTLATGRAQILAAALDSIAHQVADVLDAMDASVSGVQRLLLDGGPSRNPTLRALLAAYIGRPVVHCADVELSALGVAHLAGVGAGLWDLPALCELPRAQQTTPVPADAGPARRDARRAWASAVARARLQPGTGA